MDHQPSSTDIADQSAAEALHVLVGVDDSAESRDAVATAYEFFGEDSRYTIVSVHQSPPLIVGMTGIDMTVAGIHHRLDESIGRQIAENATSHARSAAPDDADITSRTEVGHAGSAICEVATDEQADVIVIGSHDRGLWDRLFTPSVGKYLVDHAPCPVLVVR